MRSTTAPAPSPPSAGACNWREAGFGVYLHWPFCAAKCPYCDFNSHVVGNVDQRAWSEAFVREIGRAAELTPGRTVSSIFFGGGTPSLMEPRTVAEILAAVDRAWHVPEDVEITLEANPTSVEARRLADYRAAGVNRISLGVQSLRDAELRRLGRRHDAAEALAAIATARGLFDRVSFDLIYARQWQGLGDWLAELDQALALEPDHLSLYQLTVEPGTAFGARAAAGRLRGLPDEGLVADMFEATRELCGRKGLPAYEVSNHARAGEACRHNMTYWRAGDWVGIGPGAVGRISLAGERLESASPRAPGEWLKAASAGGAQSYGTTGPADEHGEEYLMMGLRLDEGIDLARLRGLGGRLRDDKLAELADARLVVVGDGRVRATPDGCLLLNAVVSALL